MSETMQNILLEAKKWIGRETGITWGRYPVEYEPVRRWCRMVDFANPLYLDEDYARKTRWGGCLCPPFMIPFFAGASEGAGFDWPFTPREEDVLNPPTPGTKNVGVGSEFKFFKPVRIGEKLGSKRRFVDVYVKPTRYDPETFWLVRETDYFNQKMELIAVRRGESLKFRDEGQKKERKESSMPPPAAILPQVHGKLPSFDASLCFEDVEEGKELPGYFLLLDRLRFYLEASGSQNFGPFHTDEEFCKKQRLPAIFLDASFTQAALSRLVMEWIGKDGWLSRLSMEMRKSNFLGDTIAVKGKITRKYMIEEKGYVECDLWIENNREPRATVASATVELPLKKK